MIINDYSKKWLMKSNREYLTAEKLLEYSEDTSLTEAICFHSAESVEFFLKAYITTKEIPFTETGSLEYVINMCKHLDPGFENIKMGNIANYINQKWTPESIMPGLKEAHEAFRAAESVRAFVLDSLNMDVKDLLPS